MTSRRLAFVFPGQGSQFVGMGRDFHEHVGIAIDHFQRANETLGRDLLTIMFEGPEDELKKTMNTQPALFILSAALNDVLESRGIKPVIVAGHSLGEYSALYAANALDFGHALWLVKRRGELMQAAGEASTGGMAAIMGLDDEALLRVCAESGGAVVVANYNAPGQTVISGESVALAKVIESCKAAGAKRALPLPVSGAFHSPLVRAASDELDDIIDQIHFADPEAPVVTNVDGQAHTSGAELKENLKLQMMSSVRWTQTVQTIMSAGVDGIVEVGAGKVLSGLIKRIARDVPVWTVGTVEELDKVSAELA